MTRTRDTERIEAHAALMRARDASRHERPIPVGVEMTNWQRRKLQVIGYRLAFFEEMQDKARVSYRQPWRIAWAKTY